MGEELHEYLETGDISELADLVEVIHAIVAAKGGTVPEFESLRMDKRKERGGFENRLYLVSARR